MKKVRYLISSVDNKYYLGNMYDWYNGSDYTYAFFVTDFRTSRQFSSKKDAEKLLVKLKTFKMVELQKNEHNFEKIKLPETKIVKLIIQIEDIK
jgi:hypothetical protein